MVARSRSTEEPIVGQDFKSSGSDILVQIEGQTVNIANLKAAVDCVVSRLKQPSSFHVFTLNLDHLVKLRSNKKFRAAYDEAEFVTADGFPIVTLARLDGVAIERTTGSDLIVPLCRAAAMNGLPVFFFGTTLSTLCKVARTLTTQIAGLEVAGIFSPPMGLEVGSDVAHEAIRTIVNSGARICFISLSPPLQEIFAAATTKQTTDIAFIAVGAGLDFIAGTQTRCPVLLRQMNLEWAWRLLTNPRRLGLRYLRCALLFIELWGRKVLGRK